MKKYAALAVIAAIALTGCGTAAATGQSQKVTPSATPTNIYAAVWQDWEGNDRPSEDWIDTAAMLVCKRIIGGVEPRVVPNHPHNNEVVIAAAEQYLCEVDR